MSLIQNEMWPLKKYSEKEANLSSLIIWINLEGNLDQAKIKKNKNQQAWTSHSKVKSSEKNLSNKNHKKINRIIVINADFVWEQLKTHISKKWSSSN